MSDKLIVDLAITAASFSAIVLYPFVLKYSLQKIANNAVSLLLCVICFVVNIALVKVVNESILAIVNCSAQNEKFICQAINDNFAYGFIVLLWQLPILFLTMLIILKLKKIKICYLYLVYVVLVMGAYIKISGALIFFFVYLKFAIWPS